MNKILLLASLSSLLLVSLSACGGATDTPPAASPTEAPAAAATAAAETTNAVRAGALAKRIKATPDQTDAILKEADLSREAFDAMLFEIASDPKQSAQYAEAMR